MLRPRAILMWGIGTLLAVACYVPRVVAADLDPAASELFESHVRPIFAQRCQSCHGEKKQEGGLRLDHKEAALRGGENGPVIVSADPAASRLIQAIRRDGDVVMPPKETLPPDEVDVLTRWVAAGAPWPDDVSPTQSRPSDPAAIAAARASHWAFQPVRRPEAPADLSEIWSRSPIDALVLARLRREGLEPSPEADRRTLLRRLSFDVTGLPPTFAEVEAFANDDSPDAYGRAVDRLLASPAYGERWARHWLDIARYADTQGYQVGENSNLFPYAYTYRDYVIQAINDDLPFDEFLIDQLAADLRPTPRHPRALAAMGFLTVGRRFYGNTPEIIDDRIDVVTRGLLGLTVTCARCHEHKYEPITMEDYYSLYGVFQSSEEPAEPPLTCDPAALPGYAEFKAELDRRQAAVDKFVAECHATLTSQFRGEVADYLLEVVRTERPDRLTPEVEVALRTKSFRSQITRRWAGRLRRARGANDPVFEPWLRFVELSPDRFAAEAATVLLSLDKMTEGTKPGEINPLVKRAIVAKRPESLASVAEVYGELFRQIDARWRADVKGDANVAQLSEPAAEQLRSFLYGDEAPAYLDLKAIVRALDQGMGNKYGTLHAKVSQWEAESPQAPPRAMVLVDQAQATDSPIFLRGNRERPGPIAPRRFLTVLDRPERPVYSQGSGRLELARAIASPENPLTARVMVNRVWRHYFGQGIVRTTSNLGVGGESPSHPELLDYLAARFVEQHWSLKSLQREILLSATYRQSSAVRRECFDRDPENRLVWRMPRKRLEFEPLRDSLLAYAGRLDRQIGGRSVPLDSEPFSLRRGLYAYVDRQNPWSTLRIFDVANPDVSSSTRGETTVPQQALFFLNAPFVQEQARALAARPEVAGNTDQAARIAAMWQIVLQREPDAEELAESLKLVNESPTSKIADQLTSWDRLAQVLLATNESQFVD